MKVRKMIGINVWNIILSKTAKKNFQKLKKYVYFIHIFLFLFFQKNFMKKRFLLLIIFIIFVLSISTFLLILNYLDPYEYRITALISATITFVLWISTFCTLFFYFLKKIYYRWRVYLYHVLTSFRQWFFISIFILTLIFFNIVWASLMLTWFLMMIILSFLELFIQNLEQ